MPLVPSSRYRFDPAPYEGELVPIIEEILVAEDLDDKALHQIVRRYPKDGCGAFSKSEIIRGFRRFARRYGWKGESEFAERLRMKPIRTQSGVAPVTVLTKPYPCPGRRIFCPSDVRMPKIYLSREPGAQRAAQHEFDPFRQTASRLQALYDNGHRVDKVKLIVLGGTWSFYPEPYQIWFIKRCFEAMNEFAASESPSYRSSSDRSDRPDRSDPSIRFRDLEEQVDGRTMARSYNQVISDFLRQRPGGAGFDDPAEEATWEELAQAQERNERCAARCVGLVLETRPNHLSEEEVVRIRRLGATKVQIGFQSQSDAVLAANRRGHDVAATRRAVALLRQGGFKLHTHWMPNLHGSDPDRDVEDFERVFGEPDFRPDELKTYPCSLVESAELIPYHENGQWRPYHHGELLWVLSECLMRVPLYCRVTRMVRDIPGDDIFAGNRVTNFRQVVENHLRDEGRRSRDICSREIRGRPVDPAGLALDRIEYRTSTGREVFLQFVTSEDRIVGFCRLALPRPPVFIDEIVSSAVIREVHVYGVVVGIGEQRPGRARPQHLGLP